MSSIETKTAPATAGAPAGVADGDQPRRRSSASDLLGRIYGELLHGVDRIGGRLADVLHLVSLHEVLRDAAELVHAPLGADALEDGHGSLR